MKIEDLKELAKIIALAQDIRENSFVHPERISPGLVGYYTCAMNEAALKAAAQVTKLPHDHVLVEGIAQLVYLLNSELWNDIRWWSADILNLPEDGDSK